MGLDPPETPRNFQRPVAALIGYLIRDSYYTSDALATQSHCGSVLGVPADFTVCAKAHTKARANPRAGMVTSERGVTCPSHARGEGNLESVVVKSAQANAPPGYLA